MALSKQQWQSKDEFTRPKYQVQVSDIGEESVSITHVVHTIRMGDVEDPEIYAAGPMWDWQNSDQGTWCFEHALPNSLEYRIDTDIASYGYRVAIIGHFRKEDLVYFYLKWPQTS